MIVHLVPTVPPALNGLAGYCFKLSQNWPDDQQTWSCLVLSIPPGANNVWPQASFIVFEPSQQSLFDALQRLPVDTLMVHYVGYAYDSKGIPEWLPLALAAWKKVRPAARLVVMFHELWAGGAPWRRAFWTMPKAKTIVADLAGLSSCWATSCQYYFDEIVKVGGRAERGTVIPVATNIEPIAPIDFGRAWPLFEGRKLSIAIFGLATTRNTALSVHWQLLRAMQRAGLVERFCILGQSPQNQAQFELENAWIEKIGADANWMRHYDLTPAQASQWLSEQDAGIVKETVPLLTKSSVFAALCSHGILPICAPPKTRKKEDEPFIINSHTESCLMQLQDKRTIRVRKDQLQLLANTALSWSSVAQSWKHHLRDHQ